MKTGYFFHLILGTALTILFSAISSMAFAEENEKTNNYHLVYSNDSPLKSIPLNNTAFKASLYTNGIPKGHHEFQTNEEGEFDIESSMKSHPAFIGMSLVQLKDASNNKQYCEGTLLQGQNELVVRCQPK